MIYNHRDKLVKEKYLKLKYKWYVGVSKYPCYICMEDMESTFIKKEEMLGLNSNIHDKQPISSHG